MKNNKLALACLLACSLIMPSMTCADLNQEASLDKCTVSVDGAIVREVTESQILLWAYDTLIDITVQGGKCDMVVKNISVEDLVVSGIGEYEILSPSQISFEAQPGEISLDTRAEEKQELMFVVCADADKLTEQVTFEHILSEVSKVDYDLLLMPGDTVPSGQDTQFKNFVRSIGALPFPIYIAIGNHDLYNNSNSKAEYYYGESTYSFDYGPVHFVILDDAKSYITEDQYAWLESDISSSAMDYTILSCHVPPHDPRESEAHSLGEEDSLRFMSLMEQLDVDLVLNGHVHLYDQRIVNGVEYVISGGGGSPLYASEDEGGFFHYLVFTVDNNGISHDVVQVISPLYTPDIASEVITDAESIAAEAISSLDSAKSMLDKMDADGTISKDDFANVISTIEKSITSSSKSLEQARSDQEKQYWYECIGQANSAYSYALQAKISAESFMESLDDMGDSGVPVYYYGGILAAIIVVMMVYFRKR